MLNKFTLIAVASAALVGASNEEAHAAPTASFGWHLTSQTQIPNGFCNGNGLITQIGYYGETAPRVGHTQNSALVIVLRNGGDSSCGSITAIPSFEVAASDIARDPTQNVMCEWVRTDGSIVPLPNSS